MKRLVKRWLLSPGISDFLYSLLVRLKPGSPTSGQGENVDPEGTKFPTVMSQGWSEFREAASRSRYYAEYGSGESTVFVAEMTNATIRSIESDPDWVLRVKSEISRPAEVIHVDIGPTGRWGKPVSYSHATKFSSYIQAPFEQGYSPDCVLIDGRFRVACFLATLLHTKPGTTIVVDDYVTRPHYQIIESVVAPDVIGVRQAVFTRPRLIPESKVKRLLGKFEYVMD